MPELLPIQTILWQNLLRDFGITAMPRVPVWWLSDTVLPVAIVNSQVVLDAKFSEPAMQFATEGVKIAPAAGTTLADTGQLPEGVYLFRIYSGFGDPTIFNAVTIKHRNAADSASNWEYENVVDLGETATFVQEWVERVLTNERMVVDVLLTGATGRRYSAIIWRKRVGDL